MKPLPAWLQAVVVVGLFGILAICFRIFMAVGQATEPPAPAAGVIQDVEDSEIVVHFKKGANNNGNDDVYVTDNKRDFLRALCKHSKGHQGWKTLKYSGKDVATPPAPAPGTTPDCDKWANQSNTVAERDDGPIRSGVHVSQLVGFATAEDLELFMREITPTPTPKPPSGKADSPQPEKE